MHCHAVFGAHLKKEVFVTHSKNVFLNNLVLKRMSFFSSVKKPSVKLTEEVKKTALGFPQGRMNCG